jgi:hypothetical protein
MEIRNLRLLRSLGLALGLALTGGALAATPLAPLGPDFRLDLAGANGGRSVVAVDPSGTMLEAWSIFEPATPSVFARSFGRTGRSAGFEARLDHTEIPKNDVSLIAVAPGIFVAGWINYDDYDDLPGQVLHPEHGTVSARFLDIAGKPILPEIRLDVTSQAEPDSLRLAPLASGGFAAMWREESGSSERSERIVTRTFDAAGRPTGIPLGLAFAASADCGLHTVALGGLADGGFLAFWDDSTHGGNCGALEGQRVGADGKKTGPALFLDPAEDVAVRADGSFVAVRAVNTAQPLVDGFDVQAQVYDAAGRPQGLEITVAGGAGDQAQPIAAADADGRFLVLWRERASVVDPAVDAQLAARLFAADGTPAGAAFPVASARTGDQNSARLATNGRGDWAVSWRGETPLGTYPFARRFATCPDGKLCLAEGRFQASLAWRDARTGESGAGEPVPLTVDTGAFWLFDEENLEMMVKVLDARGVNGRFWVFYGALTDVEYDLTVTDTETGEVQTYHNPAGRMTSRGDTGSFEATLPEVPADTALLRIFSAPGDAPAALTLNDRFTVEATWRDPRTGHSGAAVGVPLTRDTGAFWFYGDQNLEMMVKILDGRGLNGHYWVFFSALSDAAVTLKVTDRQTGAVRVYRKAAGRLQSRADINAF